MNSVVKISVSIREALYARKLYIFVKGIREIDEGATKFSGLLFEDERTRNENALRVLQIIDKIDTEQKIPFIINVTRALLVGSISDIKTYFRIFKAIEENLYEDLIYLKDNVFRKEAIEGNDSVDGLARTGLMVSAGIDGNKDIYSQEYYISKLGLAVDQFAISFDDEEHQKKHKELDI